MGNYTKLGFNYYISGVLKSWLEYLKNSKEKIIQWCHENVNLSRNQYAWSNYPLTTALWMCHMSACFPQEIQQATSFQKSNKLHF